MMNGEVIQMSVLYFQCDSTICFKCFALNSFRSSDAISFIAFVMALRDGM